MCGYKKESIKSLLKKAEFDFKNKGISSPRLDAEVLLSSCIGKNRHVLYTNPDRVLACEEIDLFREGVEKRLEGKPLAYILGKKEFWSLCLDVNQSVLIPRPDTEVLVEEIINILKKEKSAKYKILEIGTGSGAISIAIATERKEVIICATDLSLEALAVAKRNARHHGVTGRVFFLCGNLFEPISDKFDIVVSNPPYIAEEEFEKLSLEIRNYEPYGALVAGVNGTEIHRQIVMGGVDVLKEGGWLAMEIGDGQREEIQTIIEESGGYDNIIFREDYAGLNRVVLARRGVKGG